MSCTFSKIEYSKVKRVKTSIIIFLSVQMSHFLLLVTNVSHRKIDFHLEQIWPQEFWKVVNSTKSKVSDTNLLSYCDRCWVIVTIYIPFWCPTHWVMEMDPLDNWLRSTFDWDRPSTEIDHWLRSTFDWDQHWGQHDVK